MKVMEVMKVMKVMKVMEAGSAIDAGSALLRHSRPSSLHFCLTPAP